MNYLGRLFLRVEMIEYVETYMRANKLNQVEAAAALGISQRYLRDILRGRRDPGKRLLEALGFEKIVLYRRGENEHEN